MKRRTPQNPHDTATERTGPAHRLRTTALDSAAAVAASGVHNAVDVSKVACTRVGETFIGSCRSGMWDDLEQASAIPQRSIAPHVRLFIEPGSEASTKRIASSGLMQTFIEAGAVMLPAACCPCKDTEIGPVHSGKVKPSTTTKNNARRFGTRDAKLFLGSLATVAISAVIGHITDPREFLSTQKIESAG